MACNYGTSLAFGSLESPLLQIQYIYIYIIYHLVMNEKTGKLFVLTCLAMGKNGKIQLLRSCARFSRLVFFAVFL